MNYNKHYENIKYLFPELDLVKESEFNEFKNPIFAKKVIELCILLSENASKKLHINLHFGVRYNLVFNACAITRNNSAVILFNLGLIDKLEVITSDSIQLFMQENIAGMTIKSNSKDSLKSKVRSCCITYIFHHELAHVIQSLEVNLNRKFSLQEIYSNDKHFKIKNHIYEMDADNFGSVMSGHLLLKKIMNSDYQFEPMLLFNALTLLLFTIANIIIEFSENLFQNIYYKENSHPHPFIRIVKCNEQITSFISKNLNVSAPLFQASLQRTGNIISHINYSDGRKVNYEELFFSNQEEILNYIDEIENMNQNYKELTRHRAQEIFNSLES